MNKVKIIRELILEIKRRPFIRKIRRQIPEDTSVFAMNCFGGHFCQALHRIYNTPTAGLFFYAKDFNRIIKDINIIKRQIQFKTISKFPDCKNPTYPIGVFEDTDIEIHFLHYQNPEIAKKKWERRVSRFNFDKWIAVGFCQNLWTEESIEEFCSLPHPNKVFFTNGFSLLPHAIACKEFEGLTESPSAYLRGHVYYKYLSQYLDTHPIVETNNLIQ